MKDSFFVVNSSRKYAGSFGTCIRSLSRALTTPV